MYATDMRPWLPRIVAAFVFLGIALPTIQVAVAFRDEAVVGIGAVVIFGLFMAAVFATVTHHAVSVLVSKEDSGLAFGPSELIYLLWAFGLPIAVFLLQFVMYG